MHSPVARRHPDFQSPESNDPWPKTDFRFGDDTSSSGGEDERKVAAKTHRNDKRTTVTTTSSHDSAEGTPWGQGRRHLQESHTPGDAGATAVQASITTNLVNNPSSTSERSNDQPEFYTLATNPLEVIPFGTASSHIAIIGVDIDSICVSGTDMNAVLSTVLGKCTSVKFNLVMNRLNCNNRTRFKLKPTTLGPNRISPKRRGKKISAVNLDKYKNIKLCEVKLGNMDFHVMLYFVDVDKVPENYYLDDIHLSVVVACFNAAKMRSWDYIPAIAHETVQVATGASILKSKCTNMPNLEVFDGNLRGCFKPVQFSSHNLSPNAARFLLTHFRDNLTKLANLDPENDIDWEDIPFDQYAYHGCRQLKKKMGVRNDMVKAAQFMVDGLFVHVQAVGVKSSFPNYEYKPVSILDTKSVDACIGEGMERACNFLKSDVLTQVGSAGRSNIIFSIDVAATIRPLSKKYSYMPNGTVAAQFLKSLVQGHDSYVRDPAINLVDLKDVEIELKCTDLIEEINAMSQSSEESSGDEEESVSADGNGSSPSAEGSSDDEEEEEAQSVSSIISAGARGVNFVHALHVANVNEMTDLADDPELLENDEAEPHEHDLALGDDYIVEVGANRNTYPQLCSSGFCGSAHTHQTLLEFGLRAGHMDGSIPVSVHRVDSLIYPVSACGGQVYTSEVMAFTRSHTRAPLHTNLGYFATHIQNILTEYPDPTEKLLPDEISLREIELTLDSMEDGREMFNAGYSTTDRGTAVRSEIFHIVNDLDSIKHTPVAQFPFHGFINCFYTAHINQIMIDKMDLALDPLVKTFGTPRPDGNPKDFHGLSTPAKVALMYHTELLAQILGIGCISSPILKSVKLSSRTFHFHEIGVEHQLPLSEDEMEQTGLYFGLTPSLLTRRRPIPRTLASSGSRTSVESAIQLKNDLYCVRINQVVRNVSDYVLLESKILACLHQATHSNPVVEEDSTQDPTQNSPIEDFAEPCVFERLNYEGLLSLPCAKRNNVIYQIGVYLMEMYEKEWALIIYNKTRRFAKENETRYTRGSTRIPPIRFDSVPKTSSEVLEYEDRYGSFMKVGDTCPPGSNIPTDANGQIYSMGTYLEFEKLS